MAFEAFRTQDRRQPTKLRRIVIAVAAVFHGALIAAGVIYSYWHVDELTPPTLRVTFIAAAPPPPPPPPPPPAGGGAKKVAMKPKTPTTTPVVIPRPTEIVQPREKPPAPVKKEFRKHEDEEEDEDDDAPVGAKGGVKGGTIGGVEGGTIGGTIGGEKGGVKGGTIGGTVGNTLKPTILPPHLGALQRQGCADAPFPPSLRRRDAFYLVMAKICISTAGKVESVNLLKRADTLLDEGVVASEKACHYKPLFAGGIPVPFCYIARYEFKGQ